MAFKRTNFNRIASKKNEYFASTYKFSKVTKFEIGSDVYVIPLGLETGFYETPCHTIRTHKVNGQTIGYGGFSFTTYIKCNGIDAEGNKQESLCCQLAKEFKDKYPNNDDYAKRVIGACSFRTQLPVLILGNSLAEPKLSYPVSKVSILNDLKSEKGLKFAYLDLSSATFAKSIVKAYGNKLKEDGILEYDMEETSEEYLDEIRRRLTETVIKIHGVKSETLKSTAALREYSFFPFTNPAIASQSPEGERAAIIGYKNNKEIMNKITEFLTLFDAEVDNIIQPWDERSLQEYFNSAMGLALKSENKKEETTVEKIETLEDIQNKEFSDDEMSALNDSLSDLDSVEEADEVSEEELSFDNNGEEEFFAE